MEAICRCCSHVILSNEFPQIIRFQLVTFSNFAESFILGIENVYIYNFSFILQVQAHYAKENHMVICSG